MSTNLTPIKSCRTCASCVKFGDTYTCWVEDYFIPIDPDEVCEGWIDKAKTEKENLARLKRDYPEVLDENGEIIKDPHELLNRMVEAEEKRHKNNKVVRMPAKRYRMPDETYQEYRKIAKILSDFWNIGKEGNAIKIREFSKSRLDSEDKFQVLLKDVLHLMAKGAGYEDLFIHLVTLEEARESDANEHQIYSLIRRAFLYMLREVDYDAFVEDAASRVPDEKKLELTLVLKKDR